MGFRYKYTQSKIDGKHPFLENITTNMLWKSLKFLHVTYIVF